mmetsp:Transcript_32452/g.73329  ORF Transcript_32452/g.73329 Transcript_32452/m.73329 type:complete len:360 (-) Transcript_32452:339-1418(-)
MSRCLFLMIVAVTRLEKARSFQLSSSFPGGLAASPMRPHRPTQVAASFIDDDDDWPENLHRSWEKDDDIKLWALRNGDLGEVANELGRGLGGIQSRLKRLQDPSTSAFKRLFANGEESGTSSVKCSLRPIQDVLQRILWDPSLDASEFSVGYRDRFQGGFQEAKCDTPNKSIKGKQRLFVLALPEHRIEYVKYRLRVVWHKGLRLDRVFGTGKLPNYGGQSCYFAGASTELFAEEAHGVKIDTVIENYGAWENAIFERSRLVMKSVLESLSADSDASKLALGDFKRYSKKLINGEMPALEFVELALSERFFGPKGWGVATRSDGESPLEALVEIMPEEHMILSFEVLRIISQRALRAPA